MLSGCSDYLAEERFSSAVILSPTIMLEAFV